ncbi:hypothetical protein GT348_07245 [Aristophania vespae]|uniref:Phage tail protein n=1 Tax=Aristophania vespae TaxID=2697033 RepID=A0A6P1NF18_9PROT|nr:phage tail tube protein [Aristophania vespae]QHI96058.1 hypothetical protein GT348_07245 [Aristophania vespae]UMM63825.1 hypothetical protein DM15PD_08020 [Aristophania vespae]
MAQTLGIIRFFWRGKQYDTDKSSSIKLSGIKNNDVHANFRTLRSSEYQGGQVKVNVNATTEMSLNDFDPSLGENELQLQTDLGTTIVVSDAWVREQPEWAGGGKPASVVFSFNTYQEVE